jgi:hypothetical protein
MSCELCGIKGQQKSSKRAQKTGLASHADMIDGPARAREYMPRWRDGGGAARAGGGRDREGDGSGAREATALGLEVALWLRFFMVELEGKIIPPKIEDC